ncbi:hypothetical protein L7F22_006122 [Adiantum nelumboides]|nr:hypothetical protein [Adiantum nelumboides]
MEVMSGSLICKSRTKATFKITNKRISHMEREIKEWKAETEGRWKEKTSQWKKEKEDLHAQIQALKVDSQALKEEVSTLKQELAGRTTNELEEGELQPSMIEEIKVIKEQVRMIKEEERQNMAKTSSWVDVITKTQKVEDEAEKWIEVVRKGKDPAAHSSFIELREKIFSSLEQLSILWSDAVAINEFVEDLFKVCREKLVKVELRGARYLKRIVISPPTVALYLKSLDLSCCEWLEYVLLQLMALETLSLHRCGSLKKAILHTKQLKDINLLNCSKLSVLVLWSDALPKLELSCPDLKTIELHCNNLKAVKIVSNEPSQEESTIKSVAE